jgi:hypothetical protein
VGGIGALTISGLSAMTLAALWVWSERGAAKESGDAPRFDL